MVFKAEKIAINIIY